MDRTWVKALVGVGLLVLAGWVLLPVMTFSVWFGAAFGATSKVLIAVVLVVLPLVLGLVFRRRGWSRWVWVSPLLVAGAFSACLLISATLYGAPPADDLVAEVDRVGIPAGWVQIDEDISEGSPVCFDYCPATCREYRTPADPAQAVEELRRRFDEAGYATSTQAVELSGPGFVGRAPHRYVRTIIENQRVAPDYDRWEPILQMCLEGREVP